MKTFTDKVALVTGGGSGIGRATAFAFATEGAKVIVADVSVEGGEDTVRLISEAGGEALFVKCDVSKSTEVQAMIQRTKEVYGGLDYAFNNAGIEGEMIPFEGYSEEIYDRVIDVNLKGVFLCMKYEVPEMLKRGSGSIVNTASVSGLIGAPGISAYSVSKHGVVGLTKTVALEYAKNGIRVNAICPGVVKTAMVERLIKDRPDVEKWFLDMHPVGRIASVNEISSIVTWLCSDNASFVTGASITVDGGLVAR